LMGAAAAARAELLIITDDNPRGEAPEVIRAAMRTGAIAAPPLGEVLEIGDRRDAIAAAVARAGSDDIVVVAGKGHETGQRVGDTTRPFSDVEELAAALRTVAGAR
jgi:UDP-N-acetylmuramoyl-L-alanyl-D-glutamate--2,6-diaminopimelate ligase